MSLGENSNLHACIHHSYIHFLCQAVKRMISHKICDYQTKRQKKYPFFLFANRLGNHERRFLLAISKLLINLHLKVLINPRTTEAPEQTTRPGSRTYLQTRKMTEESNARIERLEKVS